jgi:hypothetical protein
MEGVEDGTCVGRFTSASSVSIGTVVGVNAVVGMVSSVGVEGVVVWGGVPGKLHDEVVMRTIRIKIKKRRFMYSS